MSMTLDEALSAHGSSARRVRELEDELRRVQPATKADIDAVMSSLAELKVMVSRVAEISAVADAAIDAALAEHRRLLPAIATRAMDEARRNMPGRL